MAEETNRPNVSIGLGPYNVALWSNTINTDDGDRVIKSVTLRKAYFDKKEKQLKHQSISFEPAELAGVVSILKTMEQVVIEKRLPEQQF